MVRIYDSGAAGLVSALYDQLEFGRLINDSVDWDYRQSRLSPGTRIKALVINYLDSSPRGSPFYMIKQYYEDKDTENLFGRGVLPADLEGYNLTRALDKVGKAGPEKVFSSLCLQALCRERPPVSEAIKVMLESDFICSNHPCQVTPSYLASLQDNHWKFIFLLPSTIPLEKQLRERAWNGNASKGKNSYPSLQVFKEMLWGKEYSFIVVPSRKENIQGAGNLAKEIQEKQKYLEKQARKMEKISFIWVRDAFDALEEFKGQDKDSFFYLEGGVVLKEKGRRGRRPKKGRARTDTVYRLELKVIPRREAILKARQRQESYILVTNILPRGLPEDIVRTYQDQAGMRQIFTRLAEKLDNGPRYLKSERRILAYPFIGLTSLLLSRILECRVKDSLTMREGLPGTYSNQDTLRPSVGLILQDLEKIKVIGTRDPVKRAFPGYLKIPRELFQLVGVEPEVYLNIKEKPNYF